MPCARDETLSGGVERHYQLVALDPDFLDVKTSWPLAHRPSAVGKLYVADATGDRLWRVDIQRNVLLGDIPLPGAPLTLAARPA